MSGGWIQCGCLLALVVVSVARGASSTQPAAAMVAERAGETSSRDAYADVPLRADGGRSGRQTSVAPQPPPSSGLEYSRVLAALGVVVGLIFLLRWMARGFLGLPRRGSSRAVRVLGRTMIAPRQQVMLLQVGRRVVVVGDSAGRMQPLAEISDADEVAALVGQMGEERPEPRAFGNLFTRSRRTYEIEEPTPAPLQDADETETVNSAREEISGLMQKVRLLSSQFKGT